jgi:hypothetical protein
MLRSMKPIVIWSYMVFGTALVVMGILDQPLQPVGELLMGTVALLIATVAFALSRRRRTDASSA